MAHTMHCQEKSCVTAHLFLHCARTTMQATLSKDNQARLVCIPAGEEDAGTGGADEDDKNVWGPYEEDGEEAAAAELEDLDGVGVL